MRTIVFAPILDGKKRKAVVKEKVNGWKHTEKHHIHFFSRGKISYLINTLTYECELRKYDYSKACYCDVTYDDFHKFIDIITEEN